jgi:hypothetical protein
VIVRRRGAALALGLVLLASPALAQPAAPTAAPVSPVAQVARPLVPAVLVLALLALGLRRVPRRVLQALRASRRMAADDPDATADLPEPTTLATAPVTSTAPGGPVEALRVAPGAATTTQGFNARTAPRTVDTGVSNARAAVTVTALTLSFDSDVRGRLQAELDALVARAAGEGLVAVCAGLQSLLARNLGAVSAARVEHEGRASVPEARPRFDAWVEAARAADTAGPGVIAADEGGGQVVVTVVVARRQGPDHIEAPGDLRALREALAAVLVASESRAILALEVVLTPRDEHGALTNAARAQRFPTLTAMRAARGPR